MLTKEQVKQIAENACSMYFDVYVILQLCQDYITLLEVVEQLKKEKENGSKNTRVN